MNRDWQSGSCDDLLLVGGSSLELNRISGSKCHRTGRRSYTSQVYGDKGYRKIWIVGRQKELNETFATGLIVEQPVNKVAYWIATCKRGGCALCHPKIV